MKKHAIALLLSALFVAPAFANNAGKFYFAADMGPATYINVGGYSTAGTYIARIAGGYYINPAFAIEVGYTRFSDNVISNSTDNATLTASAIQIAAVGVYPLSNQFDLTGKLGMSMNRTRDAGRYQSGATSSTWDNSYTNAGLLYGVGAQYHLTSQLNLRAQYESFGSMTNTTPAVSATAFSVGIAYKF